MQYECVIGLEVHAQLKTKSKIFCGCSTEFGANPNTHVCPVCLGMPGVLPVLNKTVVSYATKLAIATNCSIAHLSRFARKNYFYPDLPKGYQISQYELPIAERGYLDINDNGNAKRIGITRIHMEEDAGKLIHDSARSISFVDLNRAGVPLLEIVSEPDIRSPSQASAYLKKLHSIVCYLDICDGNMEEGSFRCDANVSIRPIGQEKLGTRTELKNMNSFKNVEKAIRYEIDRQEAIVTQGGSIVQETRLWDADKNRTYTMRSKEEANDYRYFPEPDLLPLVIDSNWIEQIKQSLPELADQKKARFISQFGLPEYDADVLTTNRNLAEYFEACVAEFPQPKSVSNWIMTSLMGLLNSQNKSIDQSPISPKSLAKLLILIDKNVISGKIAKTVFEDMAQTGKDPQTIVEEKGLKQVTDSDAIENTVNKIIQNNPSEVEAYKNGKTKLFGFFVGQVMKETKGKANPQSVNDLLKKALG